MTTTLRTRATLLATVITAVTLVVAALTLVLTLQARLVDGTDALSRQRVDDLLAQAEAGTLPDLVANIDDEGVAQVVAADGSVLAASGNVEGSPALDGPTPDPGRPALVATIAAPDDDEMETYRVWAESVETADGPVTAYVGNSLESVAETTRTLRHTLYAGVPLMVLVLGVGTWLVLGRALRRIDRIRDEVDAITEERLDRRVPAGEADDEVGRLAATMNRMLARLEAARQRQLEFVADVSHDLQSPLASQRAQLEVARAHPETTDLAELTHGLLAGLDEMERLVRDLLVLAAADAHAAPPPSTALDLDDVVLEEAARARGATTLVIDTSGVSAAPVSADRSDLTRIVRNLLDNALAHARTTVTVVAWTAADGTVLEVSDDGPGVPPQERERIFDRFHRGDASRSRHLRGSGLGLPIARTLAERYGGTLTLIDGSRFRLTLPPGG